MSELERAMAQIRAQNSSRHPKARQHRQPREELSSLSAAQTRATEALDEFTERAAEARFKKQKLWSMKVKREKSWKRIYRDTYEKWKVVEEGWLVIAPSFREKERMGLFVSLDGRGIACELGTFDWGPDGNKSWEYREMKLPEVDWLALVKPASECSFKLAIFKDKRDSDDPCFPRGSNGRNYVPIIDCLAHFLVNGKTIELPHHD